MREEQRLAKLVRDLTSDGSNASKDRRLPRVRVDDAGTIARALHEEMDAATQARAQFAAERKLRIACERDCNACCENMIIVFEPEAIAVAQWLSQPENRDVREAFLDAYPRWREGVGDTPERLARLQEQGELDEYQRLLAEVWRKRVMCAFNRDGDCSVYPVRPNVCRSCHALDTNKHCCADDKSGVLPSVIDFPPLDHFMERTRPLMMAAHIGVRGDRRGPSALCDAVYRLLHSESESPTR